VPADNGDTVTELSGNQVRFGVIDSDVGKKRYSPGPCAKWRGRRFWENGAGEILCSTCHPIPKSL